MYGSADHSKRHVSIHAPAWGATCSRCSCDCSCKFQSTHPRGVRHQYHAPRRRSNRFNPRTRVGCDFIFEDQSRLLLFQSTHPRGVRLKDTAAERQATIVSIHAPAWGATVTSPKDFIAAVALVSIHAPAWGATMPCICISWYVMFQSTHPRGVRRQIVL